jgi:tetratricopeptide (TPR) repeat protein
VYLDEEGAKRRADAFLATAREHLAAGRAWEARAAARESLAALPGHAGARKLLEEVPEEAASPPESAPEAPAPEEAPPPAPETPAPVASAPPDPRLAEAVALSAAALRHFVNDQHAEARAAVERALALDPQNRRARELDKILRVLG